MSKLVLDRALDVLELLVEHPGGMSLSEVCRRCGMPKGAAHRLMTALVQRGYMEQDASSEWYRLTLKTTALGFRFLAESGLTDVGQPILDRLARHTQELCRLAVAQGQSLIWAAKAQGSSSALRYDPDMGMPVVLHATATGRAWLSTLDDEEAVRIVVQSGFEVPSRFNRNVITNERKLRAELAATRQRGYGLAVEEGEAGTIAVAVPVPTPNGGRSVGTLSVAGPVMRLGEDRYEVIAESLKRSALELAKIWPIRQFLGASKPLFQSEEA
jgi:IclR family transcriptional regulator, acetate operon repressor